MYVRPLILCRSLSKTVAPPAVGRARPAPASRRVRGWTSRATRTTTLITFHDRKVYRVYTVFLHYMYNTFILTFHKSEEISDPYLVNQCFWYSDQGFKLEIFIIDFFIHFHSLFIHFFHFCKFPSFKRKPKAFLKMEQ